MARRSVVLFVALLVPLLLGAPAARPAAAFTVTKTTDSADGACNADCSLREATIAANAAPGADTIVIPAGTFTLSLVGTDEDASANGDLDVIGDTTIRGAGAGATVINGNGIVTGERVLNILGGTVVVSDVTITGGRELGNSYPNSGGGVFIEVATHVTIRDVVVSGNHSEYWSGGLDIEAPTLLENVTVSNNTSDEAAGGLEIEEDGVRLINVTLSGNAAKEHGGAIALHDDLAVFRNLTIVGNRSDSDSTGGNHGGGGLYADGTVHISNSVISGNNPGAAAHPDCLDTSTMLTSLGYNLVGAGSCTFTATGDLVGLDPMLTTLADHGGSVPTHAPKPGSPLIDAGNPAAPGADDAVCAPTDQRGAARPADGNRDGAARCDIGAVEALGKSVALKARPRRVEEGAKTRLIARIIPCLGHEGDAVTFFRKSTKIGKKTTNDACVARMRAKVQDAVRFRAKVAADDDDRAARDAVRVRLRP